MADEYDLRLRRFREEAVRALDERRPDRYTVSDTTEDDDSDSAEQHDDMAWLDEVAAEVADMLPDKTVKQLYARTVLDRMETNALRRGNRQVRKYYLDQQPQLGWLETTGYPLQVVHRITKPGERVRIRRERVRIAAMTADDLRIFATEERKNAAKEFGTRNETCQAAEWMADQLIHARAKTVREWIKKATAKGEAA